jgi:Flp pilus assembly protein TadG
MGLRLHPHPPIRGRRRGERGATLVELAFVCLFIVTILAGTYDLGQGWRGGLATNEASRTAARTTSAMGKKWYADYYGLSGAKAALANSGMLNYVQRVVIFKATTADGAVPTECTTATSTTQLCNIITGDQFRAMTQASFNTTTGCMTSAQVKNWCPSSRTNVQLTSDYFGVWINVKIPKMFKFLGQTTSVSRETVMRLEPTEQ